MPFKDNDKNIVSVVIPMSMIKEDVPKIMKDHKLGMYGYTNKIKEQEYHPESFYDEVSDALQWIGTKSPTKRISNKSVGSYSAKHMAEKWLGIDRNENVYIPNGALIIAALMRDFPVKRIHDTPNAFIGISKKTLTKQDGVGA